MRVMPSWIHGRDKERRKCLNQGKNKSKEKSRAQASKEGQGPSKKARTA